MINNLEASGNELLDESFFRFTNINTSLYVLRNRMLDITDRTNAIHDSAVAQGREMDAQECEEVDRLLDEFDELQVQLKRAEKLEYTNELISKPNPRRAAPSDPKNSKQFAEGFTDVPNRSTFNGQHRIERAVFIDLKTGERLRNYAFDERMGKEDFGGDPVGGQLVTAIATGNLRNLPSTLRNSVSSISGSDGGYLVPVPVSSVFIDSARAKSTVMRHGATSIPLTSGAATIAKINTDPTVHWADEGVKVKASKPVFGAMTVKTHKCAAIVPLTIEWIEDSANGPAVIQSVVIQAIAQALDQAALTGSGVAQPRGVVNDPGVNAQTSVGLVSSYAEVRTGIRDILNANFNDELERLTMIAHPSIGNIYDGLKTGLTSDESPLPKSPWVSRIAYDYTTALAPNGSNYTSVIGDFSQILYAVRLGEMRVEFISAGEVSDGTDTFNAVSQFLRFLRVWTRVDVVVLRPAWFSVLSGMTLT